MSFPIDRSSSSFPWACLLLLGLAVCSFVGCGKKAEVTDADKEAAKAEEASKPAVQMREKVTVLDGRWMVIFTEQRKDFMTQESVRETIDDVSPIEDYTGNLAIVFGDIRDGQDIPVRLQAESVGDDVFGKSRPLDAYMERIAKAGRGVIVYLREGSVGVGHQEGGRDHLVDEAHAEARQRENEWLEIGLGAQILKDLGITSIRLLASRERHYVGLEGFGIAIAETEICP